AAVSRQLRYPLPTAPVSHYTTLFRSYGSYLLWVHPPTSRQWPSHQSRSRTVLLKNAGASLHAYHLGQYQIRLTDYHHEQFLSARSEEHTSELQSRENLVCRLLLEQKN